MDFSSIEFRNQIKPIWQRFLEEIEPLRTELFGLGMKLTRNPFDAEDLVADSLLKAFTYSAINDNKIESPRAFVTKVMVTTWIDEKRRTSPDELLNDPEVELSDSSETEEAIDRLFVLHARARAVVILKDVLGYTHEEIAEMLSITKANAKVVLHRAKTQLADVEDRKPRASRVCVQRFVDAFLTYDVEQIRQVLIEDVVAENFPVGSGTGIEHHVKEGWIRGSFYHHSASHEANAAPYPLELVIQTLCGEHLILVYRNQNNTSNRALEEVWRLEEVDGQVAKIIDYCFQPDLLRWVAKEVGVKYRPLEMG